MNYYNKSKSCLIFQIDVGVSKNFKNFVNLCLHKQNFGLDAEWIFFPISPGKSPCDEIGGSVKRYAVKRSLQRPMNNQIIGYQAMLTVWKEEMRKNYLGSAKEQWMKCVNHLRNGFQVETLFQVHEAAITS